MRVARLGAVCTAAVILAACKIGPQFKPPEEAVPGQYAALAATAGAPNPDEAALKFWWREFHDPALDQLERKAVDGNLDLQAAYLRIVEARTQVMAARAEGVPTLAASASYNREQLGLAGILKSQHVDVSGNSAAEGLISSLEKPTNLYQLGFDASWELDLFGKVRRSVEAAEARGAGAVQARNDLQISLEAEVAQNYLQMRAAQLLAKISRDQIAAQQEVVALTQDRQQHGLSAVADVETAKAQSAILSSQLPQYEQTEVASRHALAVLTGSQPQALDEELRETADFPLLPAVVPFGIPSQLARRRPDIRESEAALHVATAQVGVAEASLFPDISLQGTLGLRNLSPGYLFDWDSHFYSFGPTVSIPIFRGGALVANVRLSKAQAAEAVLSYRKAVLNALQEVEDGLNSLQHDAARIQALQESVSADQRALEFDMDAYRHGLITYISVLTLQIQVVQARQQLAQALLAQSGDLVRLYKALGGGWDSDTPDAEHFSAETR